jgi:molybdopterin/thiamine biosynthesis adenylyltransferase
MIFFKVKQMTLDTIRQFRLVDFSKLEVTLVGCGGLGSWIGTNLGKSGLNQLDLFDHDKVEPHNISNSAFEPGDEGRYKTNVLSERISQCGTQVSTHLNYCDQTLRPVVISAVDSISARRNIFKEVLKQADKIDFYIDSRMGGLVGNIFVIDPCNFEQVSWYQDNWLFEESEVVLPRCGESTTPYTNSIVGGFVVSTLNNLTKDGQLFKGLIIDLKNSTNKVLPL